MQQVVCTHTPSVPFQRIREMIEILWVAITWQRREKLKFDDVIVWSVGHAFHCWFLVICPLQTLSSPSKTPSSIEKVFMWQCHIFQASYNHILYKSQAKLKLVSSLNCKINQFGASGSSVFLLLVSEHVCLQPTRDCKWIFTNVTFVRFLSRVGGYVYIQMLRSRKGLATVTTFLWLLACVGEHVPLQISILSKWFPADFTFVGFFFSVSSHVRRQLPICSKGLVADFTLVWLCSSVSELMCLENWRSGKGLVALSALERLFSAVANHVLHQVRGASKWFSALGTFVWFLPIGVLHVKSNELSSKTSQK